MVQFPAPVQFPMVQLVHVTVLPTRLPCGRGIGVGDGVGAGVGGGVKMLIDDPTITWPATIPET